MLGASATPNRERSGITRVSFESISRLEVGSRAFVRGRGSARPHVRLAQTSHLVELLPGGDLLGEQGRLNSVEESFQPTHQLGVSDAQLEAVSFGKEKPAVNGADEAAFSKNRRVEIKY